jgi:hypothetical protein
MGYYHILNLITLALNTENGTKKRKVAKKCIKKKTGI